MRSVGAESRSCWKLDLEISVEKGKKGKEDRGQHSQVIWSDSFYCAQNYQKPRQYIDAKNIAASLSRMHVVISCDTTSIRSFDNI